MAPPPFCALAGRACWARLLGALSIMLSQMLSQVLSQPVSCSQLFFQFFPQLFKLGYSKKTITREHIFSANAANNFLFFVSLLFNCLFDCFLNS